MSKTKTQSFILELPLKKGDKDESVLLTRFEAARQLYNACYGRRRVTHRTLGEAKKLNDLKKAGIEVDFFDTAEISLSELYGHYSQLPRLIEIISRGL